MEVGDKNTKYLGCIHSIESVVQNTVIVRKYGVRPDEFLQSKHVAFLAFYNYHGICCVRRIQLNEYTSNITQRNGVCEKNLEL
jgi:hypothetical protein